MSIGNGAPAWPSVIVSNGGISPSDHTLLGRAGGSLRQKDLQDGYLGFIVVKPLPRTIIGRTCLKTYDSKGGTRHFPIVRRYPVHLFGIPLRVETLAFQEQDQAVGGW